MAGRVLIAGGRGHAGGNVAQDRAKPIDTTIALTGRSYNSALSDRDKRFQFLILDLADANQLKQVVVLHSLTIHNAETFRQRRATVLINCECGWLIRLSQLLCLNK